MPGKLRPDLVMAAGEKLHLHQRVFSLLPLDLSVDNLPHPVIQLPFFASRNRLIHNVRPVVFPVLEQIIHICALVIHRFSTNHCQISLVYLPGLKTGAQRRRRPWRLSVNHNPAHRLVQSVDNSHIGRRRYPQPSRLTCPHFVDILWTCRRRQVAADLAYHIRPKSPGGLGLQARRLFHHNNILIFIQNRQHFSLSLNPRQLFRRNSPGGRN